MASTNTDLQRIHATVGALVERVQPPEHLWDEIRHELEVEGHRVRIWTIRPVWNDRSQKVRSGVAQFTYNRTQDSWTLYWMRADGRWHAWDPAENNSDLESLVRIVEEDRRGGFWG